MFRRVALVLLPVAALLLAPVEASSQPDGASVAETYQSLMSDMALADEARAVATSGSEGWREATMQALDIRREMVALISRSVRDGLLPAGSVERAAADRLLLIQNIVVLLTELGDCNAAETAIRLLEEAAGSSDQQISDARVSARERVEQCTPASTPASAPVATGAPATDEVQNDDAAVSLAPAPEARRSGRRLALPITLGALSAGAFAVSAVGYVRSGALADDFDEYPDTPEPTVDGYAAIAKDGRRNQRLGSSMLVVGFGLAVVSTIAVVVGGERDPDADVDVTARRARVALEGDGFAVRW